MVVRTGWLLMVVVVSPTLDATGFSCMMEAAAAVEAVVEAAGMTWPAAVVSGRVALGLSTDGIGLQRAMAANSRGLGDTIRISPGGLTAASATTVGILVEEASVVVVARDPTKLVSLARAESSAVAVVVEMVLVVAWDGMTVATGIIGAPRAASKTSGRIVSGIPKGGANGSPCSGERYSPGGGGGSAIRGGGGKAIDGGRANGQSGSAMGQGGGWMGRKAFIRGECQADVHCR